jgi:hypothetical protein
LLEEHSILLQENNINESDCYISIALEYCKDKSDNWVSTKIKFKNGDDISKSDIISDPFKLVFSKYHLYPILIKSFQNDIAEAIFNDYKFK